MAVRGEEVASSIEAHVREAIERMVGEIRSSVEDVRAAVDSQLKAALQSVQADVNSISFLPHIQKSVGELEESLKAAQPPAPPVPAASASRVKQAVQAVDRSRSQIDVLNALLEQCLHFGSRAALLILRGETFSGWKGVGFSAHGGNDEQVKRFNAAPGLIPELDRVLRNEQVVIWDGANLAGRFGVSGSARAILVPMVIKDKVAAAVYVDAVAAEVGKLDPASLEMLVFVTGLLIDTLAIRKKIPSPSLNEPAGPAFAPAPAAAPPARPSAPARPAAAAAPQSTMAIPSAQLRDAMVAHPTFSGTVAVPTPAAPHPPPPKSSAFATSAVPPVAAQRTGAPLAPPAEERASTQFIPPSGISTRAAGPPP